MGERPPRGDLRVANPKVTVPWPSTHRLAVCTRGWLVPAYTYPKNPEDLAVLRIVVLSGMACEMADNLLDDLRSRWPCSGNWTGRSVAQRKGTSLPPLIGRRR